MLERRAAAVAVQLASPPPPPAPLTPTSIAYAPTDHSTGGWSADLRITCGMFCSCRWVHAARGLCRCRCIMLTLLQAAGGIGSIWAASDVRVLGEAEGQEDAAI